MGPQVSKRTSTADSINAASKLTGQIPKVPPQGALTAEQVRDKMCTGKVKYDSELHAFWTLREMEKAGVGKITKKMHPYECRWCSSWHVGHRRVGKKTATDARIDELVRELSALLGAIEK